jgi:hypothetical protein
MLVTFRKIKEDQHEFRAQDRGAVYQGTLNSSPSGRGSTLTDVESHPPLDAKKEGEVMSKFIKYKKQRN